MCTASRPAATPARAAWATLPGTEPAGLAFGGHHAVVLPSLVAGRPPEALSRHGCRGGRQGLRWRGPPGPRHGRLHLRARWRHGPYFDHGRTGDDDFRTGQVGRPRVLALGGG